AQSAKGARRLGHGQSDRLQLATLESFDAVPARRSSAGGQQLDREPDQADCNRQEQLVVCGLAACWPKGGGGDEPDSVGQTEWTRPARVLERCADEVADTHEQPDLRAAAAPLETGLVSTCPRFLSGHVSAKSRRESKSKMGWPDAYE
ncbi:Uncharacterized protein APZ42_003983, partial [Daphnia magna]